MAKHVATMLCHLSIITSSSGRAKFSSHLGLSVSIAVLIAYRLLVHPIQLHCHEFCGNLGNKYEISDRVSGDFVHKELDVADYVIIDRPKRSPSGLGRSSERSEFYQHMSNANKLVRGRKQIRQRRQQHANGYSEWFGDDGLSRHESLPIGSHQLVDPAVVSHVIHASTETQRQNPHHHVVFERRLVAKIDSTNRGGFSKNHLSPVASSLRPTPQPPPLLTRPRKNIRLDSSESGPPAYETCTRRGVSVPAKTGPLQTGSLVNESSGNQDGGEPKSRTIETAVFIDQALDTKFNGISNGLVELNKLVLTIMNQVQYLFEYSSLQLPIKLKLVLIEHLKESERQLGLPAPSPERGDIDAYLSNFCNWQKTRLSRETRLWWDHAILLSGLDLYKVTPAKNYTGVLGLAWVGGMCKGNYSCTINEATNFESAFVIAHEIGHSLGIMHDGQKNNCNANSYIMSERTGAGKVHWSKCSNNYLNESIQRAQLTCLESEQNNQIDSLYDLTKLRAPGQVYTINEQCKWAFGNNYSSFVTQKSPFNAVCRELWCVSGTWAKAAHPALEGSSCGDQERVCREGKCVR